MIVLIHPPVVKPSEPPAGAARLLGALHAHGIPGTIIDANLEGLLYLMEHCPRAPDPWTRRAHRRFQRHLQELRGNSTYGEPDRYRQSVGDLNRLVEMAARPASVRLSLANYHHGHLSPVRSADLLRASERPEENPFFPYFKERLLRSLEDLQPTWIGFSLNYLSQALCTFAMLGFLRREYPGVRLVAGGGLVTSWMRNPGWRNPFGGLVDHLVGGPGESALLSLLGIHVQGEVTHTPCYDGFPSKDYLAPGFILPYSASNGCYWSRCTFCPERAEGNPYRPIPPFRTAKDLRRLQAKTRPILIHFLDNAISPALFGALCKDPPGSPWYGFARIIPHLAEEEFCRALRQSGCVLLKLGLESGDQGVLDGEQKGIDLEVASRALRHMSKWGIGTYVYLLFGTPSESLTEARKTLEFTVRHGDSIDFLNLAIFNLPVHGPQTAGLETRMHYEGDLSLYADFRHPKGWNRSQVRQFLEREFKKHPSILPILRSDPPIFSSNHAPFVLRRNS